MSRGGRKRFGCPCNVDNKYMQYIFNRPWCIFSRPWWSSPKPRPAAWRAFSFDMLLTPRARVCQQSALIIALQFIPTFWLFVLPLTGAMSSGMLPPMWKPNLNNASGAAKFLCFPMVPLLLIFVVFLLAAGMVVDAAVAEVENPILL